MTWLIGASTLEAEQANILVDRLHATTLRYVIEIGSDNTISSDDKNANGNQRKIKGKGSQSEENDKYLRS